METRFDLIDLIDLQYLAKSHILRHPEVNDSIEQNELYQKISFKIEDLKGRMRETLADWEYRKLIEEIEAYKESNEESLMYELKMWDVRKRMDEAIDLTYDDWLAQKKRTIPNYSINQNLKK